MTSRPWPVMLPVRHVRIARPAGQLDKVVRFYREGLGLPELDCFAGHAGYRGVLFGLPGTQCHLEFTRHDRGSPGPRSVERYAFTGSAGCPPGGKVAGIALRDRVWLGRQLGSASAGADSP